MKKHDVLQRIHWNDDAEEELDLYDYAELKRYTIRQFEKYVRQGCKKRVCVNAAYYYDCETAMEENGMEKLACTVLGLLFEIEHGDVDPNLAYTAAMDIRDFETGNYDDLFTPEDLAGIKADIAKAKAYLLDHKELLEDIKLKD